MTVQEKGFLIGKLEAVASVVIQGETISANIVMTNIPANHVFLDSSVKFDKDQVSNLRILKGYQNTVQG